MRREAPDPLHRLQAQEGRYTLLGWPDLVTCHCARQTQELLESEGIPFVPKKQNPPCCPQLRSMEDVWAMLKAKTYIGSWEAKSEEQLKGKIGQSMTSLNQEVLKKKHDKGVTTARAQGCTCRGTAVCALSSPVITERPSACPESMMIVRSIYDFLRAFSFCAKHWCPPVILSHDISADLQGAS